MVNRIEEKLLMNRKFLWAGLVCCLPLYFVEGLFLSSPSISEPLLNPQSHPQAYFFFRLFLLFVAGADLWFAGFLRRKSMNEGVAVPLEELNVSIKDWDALLEEQRDRIRHICRFVRGETLAWNLSMAVSILGFILFLLSAMFGDLLLFVLLAGVGFFLFRPQPLIIPSPLTS